MTNNSFVSENHKPIGVKLSDWIFIVLCAFLLLFDSRPWDYLRLIDFILLLCISSSVFFLLWWSDRYEREPGTSIIWAFAWGAFPACLLSIIFGSIAGNTVSGAFLEEFFKLIGLMIAFKRGNIQSWMDGLIIGGYIGLGFAVYEDIIYAISENDVTSMIIDRGLFSIFSHTFFSGIGAVIIVFGLLTRRFWLQLIGFTVAFTLHLLWNTVLDLGLFPYINEAFFFFYAVLPPTVVITSAILLRIHEKNLLEIKATVALKNGQITEETFNLIKSLRMRREYLSHISSATERSQHRQRIHAICRQILS